MNYIKKLYIKTAVEAQISTFTAEGGTTEYQVILTGTDPFLPFTVQLKNILQAYVSVVENEISKDAVAVFRRYFLSDASNQTDAVLAWECENNLCPLSIVQQPPLNGTKIAVWTYLQTGMELKTYDNGMLAVAHNGYEHYWTGGAYNKAKNSEFQTRLLLNDYVMQLMNRRCTLAHNCICTKNHVRIQL